MTRADRGNFLLKLSKLVFFFPILFSISYCLLFTCSSPSGSSPSPCPSLSLSLCSATSATHARCLASPESSLGASSGYSLSLSHSLNSGFAHWSLASLASFSAKLASLSAQRASSPAGLSLCLLSRCSLASAWLLPARVLASSIPPPPGPPSLCSALASLAVWFPPVVWPPRVLHP